MSNSEVMFFLGAPSIRSAFEGVEHALQLKYARCGQFDSDSLDTIHSVEQIADLGVATNGSQVLESAYLAVHGHSEIRVRRISCNDGSTRWAVDQLENRASVVCRFGGRHESGAFIAGVVNTAWSSAFATMFLKLLRKQMNQVAELRSGFWCDDLVLQSHRSGSRLCCDVRSPREFDVNLGAR